MSRTSTTRRRPRRAPVLLLASGLALGLAAFPASAAKDELDLVSRTNGSGGAGADDGSFAASISADGRYVAFSSDANNLSAEDIDPVVDVFVRDLVANTTTLVSRANGSGGAGGDADSESPAISADGRYVAFESEADNLSTGDAAATADIFVRDLVANTTTLVSRANGSGGAGGDDDSEDPAISSDGRFVAFESGAVNLSSEDDDTVFDIFVRDLQANTTTFASRANGSGGAGGDDETFNPSISADGRYVAFQSRADNLSAEDSDSGFAEADIFVRDLEANTTTLVSRANGSGGVGAEGFSGVPSISADGRRVAFSSDADNLSAEDDDASGDIFVRDLVANTTTFVSRANGSGGVGGDDGSSNPSISADGRYVIFDSDAANLSAEDDDGVRNIFARDLVASTTTLVSRAEGSGGAGGDDDSGDAAVSANGRYVAFDSDADNLSPVDNDSDSDVFRRDVLGPPPTPLPPPAQPPPVVTFLPAPTEASPLCATVPPRRTSGKDRIVFSREALQIQQRIDAAVIRRLNAANAWIDRGIVPTDLCAGSFGPGAFQEGISFAGGAAHDPRRPTPREIQIIKRQRPPGRITASLLQLQINENISRALRARAVATVRRIQTLTGGNLAPGTTLARRELYPGLFALDPKPPSAEPAATELEIGALPPRLTLRRNAATARRQQRRSQTSIVLANRALDAITGGLTEENFQPGSIGSGRV